MNVLVATDMEGIAGIDSYGDCLPSRVLLAHLHLGDGGSARRSVAQRDPGLCAGDGGRGASSACRLGGSLRICVEGKELARTTVEEPADLLTQIAAVFRSSQVSREYRQLAKLLPAGHDSRMRMAQRRLGSLVATPVMRSKERRWLASADARG